MEDINFLEANSFNEEEFLYLVKKLENELSESI